MKLPQFKFKLPEEKIALHPTKYRDCRLYTSFHSLKKKKRGLIVGVLGCMAERVKDDLITNHHVDLVVGPDAYLTLP